MHVVAYLAHADDEVLGCGGLLAKLAAQGHRVSIVLATDGIGPEFSDDLSLKDLPQQAADRLLARFRREADDALVLVARYRGPAPAAH